MLHSVKGSSTRWGFALDGGGKNWFDKERQLSRKRQHEKNDRL